VSDYFLETKFFIPPLNTRLVSRPHLLEKLDAGLQPGIRLILISAPAGFGKTTLTAEWIESIRLRRDETPAPKFGWLSLEEEDNDPGRFLSYLMACIKAAKTGIPDEVFEQIKAQASSPKTTLSRLINPLAGLPGRLTLILEDYHSITEPSIHEGMIYFIDHMPSNLRLVLTTRADPPFALARLRARRQMIELRGSSLRFELGETKEFMNQVMELNLSLDEVQDLETHTEGWITGLQLAALSMQGQTDSLEFITAFTGSHRFIFDYLAEEVFRLQPETTQTFLLNTSILDRMSGQLCDSVVNQRELNLETSQNILEQLEQNNLFIFPLDNQRQWYRYHHLFADFLQSRLFSSQPDQFAILHQRAAHWFEQNDLLYDAVYHALQSTKTGRMGYEDAAGLIEKVAPDALQRGEINILRKWLNTLTEEMVKTRPNLCIYYAWMMLVTAGPGKQVELWITHLEQLVKTFPDQTIVNNISNHIQILQMFFNINQEDPFKGFELSRQVIERLSENDAFLIRIASLIVDMGSRLTGEEYSPSFQDTSDTNVLNQSMGTNSLIVQLSSMSRGMELKMRGHLHQAEKYFRLSLEIAETMHQTQTIFPIVAYLSLGDLLCERNELDAAEQYIQKLFLVKSGMEIAEFVMDGHLTMARIHQARGDWDRACQEYNQLHHFFKKLGMPWFEGLIEMHEIRLSLRQKNFEPIEGRMTRNTFFSDEGLSTNPRVLQQMIFERNTQTRIHLVLRNFNEAESIARNLLNQDRTNLNYAWVIETQMLLALALAGQRRETESIETICRVLTLAEHEGFVRILLDEGEPLIPLLELARAASLENRLKKYIDTLLLFFQPAKMQEPGKHTLLLSILDPLSDREIEVLNLITAGFSNKMIAERLYLAESTVKSHIKHIYSKLNVESRTQAVSRARELNLVC